MYVKHDNFYWVIPSDRHLCKWERIFQQVLPTHQSVLPISRAAQHNHDRPTDNKSRCGWPGTLCVTLMVLLPKLFLFKTNHHCGPTKCRRVGRRKSYANDAQTVHLLARIQREWPKGVSQRTSSSFVENGNLYERPFCVCRRLVEPLIRVSKFDFRYKPGRNEQAANTFRFLFLFFILLFPALVIKLVEMDSIINISRFHEQYG